MFPRAAIETLESRIAPAAMLALTENNQILRFDSASPHNIQGTVAITGMEADQFLVAMDFDPDAGFLWGLAIDSAKQGHIYRVNAGTGAASFLVTLQPKPLDDLPYSGLSGNHFSLDFALSSLSVGHVRIVSDGGHNLLLTDLGSGIVETQPSPRYTSTDVNFGAALAISGATYNNTRPDGFYAIDVESDRLVYGYPKTRIELGEYSTSRPLGVDATGPVGMDLQRSDRILYASLQVNGVTGLYHVKHNGEATTSLVALIGTGATVIRDIALIDTVWSGLGQNNLWSNPENWASGLPPAPGSTVIIPNEGGVLTTVNDFATFTAFQGLTLHGDQILAGASIALRSGLWATGSATVQLDIQILQGPPDGMYPTLSAGVNSDLFLQGALDIKSNRMLLGGSGGVNILGSVTGSGMFEVNGARALIHGNEADDHRITVFSGSLTFTGETSHRVVEVTSTGRFTGGSPVSFLNSFQEGIVSPGHEEIGSIIVNNLGLHQTTKFEFQVDGAGSLPKNDVIVSLGDLPVSLAGELILSDVPGSNPGSRFILLQNEGNAPIVQGFAGIAEGQLITTPNYRYLITYEGGDGNDVELIQLLEAVIAPDGKTASYTDVDGDLVRVTVSHGALARENFTLIPTRGHKFGELVRVDLTGLPDATKVSFRATPQDLNGDRRPEGDGYLNIGSLDASGVSLGDVVVDGNLAQIVAGKSLETFGVKSLSLHSLGRSSAFAWDLDNQYESTITGHLGKLSISADVSEASLLVLGNIGPISIGGSVVGGVLNHSGKVAATGDVASVIIRGNIQGGSGEESGMISAEGSLRSLIVGGAIRGGSAPGAGSVATGKLSTLSVGGDVVGGSSNRAGAIVISADLINATVKGTIWGGDGTESGSLIVHGSVGRLTVAHGMHGGSGHQAGSLIAGSNILAIKVGGTLSGDVVSHSGDLKQLTVVGSFTGFQGDRTLISANGIGRVTFTGDASFADIATAANLGNISIGGQVVGLGIYAKGNPHLGRAIATVKIGGNFVESRIVVGFSFADAMFSNPDTSIGSIVIGGDFIESDIAAGIDPGDGQFGNADDRVIGDGGNSALLSQIASITIRGQAHGNSDSSQHYGIIAESLGKVRLGRVSVELSSALDDFVIGHGLNLHIREEVRALPR